MKKMMSLTMALLLLVSMMALAGCSGQQKEMAALVGTWKSEVDLVDMINQELAEDETAAEYFQMDEFAVTMILTFTEEGTYTIAIDEASMDTAFAHLMEVLEEGIVKMLEDEIAASGLQISVEDMLNLGGTSLEAMMEEMKKQFEEEGTLSQMLAEAKEEGNFQAKDGKLFMSDGLDFLIDEEEYDLYTLDGDVLTVTEHVGGEAEEQALYPMLYPLVFLKASE